MKLSEPNYGKIKHIGAYSRVSTREQAEEGISLGTQRARMEKWAEGRNLQITAFFEDAGYSGALGWEPKQGDGYRPALAETVKAIERGTIDAIVVDRLDRIFRSPAICVKLLQEILLPNDVHLFSVTDGFDSTTPQGRMMIHLMSVIAGYFLEWMRENISDNLQQRKQDGHPMGKAPYAWEYEEQGDGQPRELARVETEGEHLTMMKDMYLNGNSLRSIADKLHEMAVPSPSGGDLWHEGVIQQLLKNPKHAGYVDTKDGLVEATHYGERYWDLEEYQRIMDMFESRRQMSPGTASSPEYLLSGKLFCAHCGNRMYGRRPKDEIRRRYRCASNRHHQTERCGQNSKVADVVERCVVQMLRKASQNEEVQKLADNHLRRLADEGDRKLRKRKEELARQLQEMHRKIDRWNELYTDEDIDREQLKNESNKLLDQKARIEAQIEEVDEQLDKRGYRVQRLEEMREILQNFDDLWGEMDIEERRHAVHTVVERATLEANDDGSATLTVEPHFLEPRTFRIPHLRRATDVGGGKELTLRQLALLELHHQGFDTEAIADRWNVTEGSVRAIERNVRNEMESSLEEAYGQVREHIDRYQHALPMEGRLLREEKTESAEVLTDRQQEILRLVLTGKEAQTIAEILAISVNTVYVHLHNARDALRTSTDKETAQKARYLGLLDEDGEGEPPEMTPRELAYLKHVDEGRTDEEIAALWKTEGSVARNVAMRIRRKLDVEDAAEAVDIVRDQIEVNLHRLPLEGQVFSEGDRDQLDSQSRQFLRDVLDDLTYSEIADKHGCSVGTVDYHLAKAREILETDTSKQAAEKARELGMI